MLVSLGGKIPLTPTLPKGEGLVRSRCQVPKSVFNQAGIEDECRNKDVARSVLSPFGRGLG